MNRLKIAAAGFVLLGMFAGHALAADATRPADAPGTRADEITAALPVIPDKTFTLTDYGAVGDGKTFNTDAFTKAVQAIEQAGGGHLIVPAGTWLTKSFSLTSHMDLHLDRGTIIKAPITFADYGLPDPAQQLAQTRPSGGTTRPGGGTTRPFGGGATRPFGGGRRGGGFGGGGTGGSGFGARRMPPLISASNVTDVSITGDGTIDGSGEMFWLTASGAARRYMPSLPTYPRPVLVSVRGTRLRFAGVTLTNSPMFHLTPSGQDITIEDLHIVAPSDAPNTDAMDLRGQRIVVRRCQIDVGDDDVEIGGPCHDVLVEDLTCLHGHGISIGSPTVGGVSHVIVRRCTFNGSENALRIKSARGRGGLVEDIRFSDISIKNITKRPIDITMLYAGTREAVPGAANIPEFRDIRLSNITITRAPDAGRIIGLPEQLIRDVTLENVKIQTDKGLQVQDAEGITLKNVQFDVAVGGAITTDNAKVNQQD